MNDIATELQKGLALHRDGDLAGAAEAYRSVLNHDPRHPDALNLLSIVFYTAGNFDLARNLAALATEAQPNYFAAYLSLGNALQALGELHDAVEAFRRGAELNPESGEAWTNLSSALNAIGQYDAAAAASSRAVGILPDLAAAHNNFANALAGLERHEDALAAYSTALELEPDFADAMYNRAGILMALDRGDEAELDYRRALALAPDDPEKHYNLGNLLMARGKLEEAVACFRHCLAIRPGLTDALNNLGAALQGLGRLDEATDAFREALGFEPENAELHWNLALALLQSGRWRKGWEEYEWRWKHPAFIPLHRPIATPQWQGEPVREDETVLVLAEQGYGDAIHFCRFLPMMRQRMGGGRLVVECRPGLERLIGAMDGVDEAVTLAGSVPAHDRHIALMSLPRIFKVTLETVPNEVPYLALPPGTPVDERIAQAEGLKVGIAWAGSATNANDRNRSVALDRFAAFADIPGVSLFSLQVGQAAEALTGHPGIVDLGSDFGDFADTAAAIAALDMVVGVDTAVVHLAGALGKPAWVLLPYVAGYLYMNEREDSPWYPTMRLFRQHRFGDWDDVFARAGEALAEATRG